MPSASCCLDYSILIWLLTMSHSCVSVSLLVYGVKLRAPAGPDDETDCSTRRRACRGVGQVRVFIVTGLVTMVTVQSPTVQWLCCVMFIVFASIYQLFCVCYIFYNNLDCCWKFKFAFKVHVFVTYISGTFWIWTKSKKQALQIKWWASL